MITITQTNTQCVTIKIPAATKTNPSKGFVGADAKVFHIFAKAALSNFAEVTLKEPNDKIPYWVVNVSREGKEGGVSLEAVKQIVDRARKTHHIKGVRIS